MKTLRFKPLMAGVAIALMVGFVSCEKAMDEPVAVSYNNSFESKVDDSPGWKLVYEPGQPLGFCMFDGKNCWHPPFDVVGEKLAELDSSISSGSKGVQSYFVNKSNWSQIFPDLVHTESEPFLEKLQSGNYSMVKKNGVGNILLYVAEHNDEKDTFEIQVVPH